MKEKKYDFNIVCNQEEFPSGWTSNTDFILSCYVNGFYQKEINTVQKVENFKIERELKGFSANIKYK